MGQGGKVSDNGLILLEKVQVFAKDASHGLSLEKLEYNLNKKHPRVMHRDPNTKKVSYNRHACCGTRTGIHLCCKS
jgi:hypothetical protein